MKVEEEERPHGQIRERLVFSSGRRLDIWGAIGLNPKALTLHYGYDGDLCEDFELTTDERIELALYMVEKWQTALALARADQYKETRRVEEGA